MAGITALNRDKVFFGVGNGVKKENAVDYAEVRHTVKDLVLDICRGGFAVTFDGDGVFACLLCGEVELEAVRTDVALCNGLIALHDGDTVAYRCTERLPGNFIVADRYEGRSGSFEYRVESHILCQHLIGVLAAQLFG